jgi:AraC family transcriptional regulator
MKFRTTDYRKRIFRAMNYISRNIERSISLEEIAKEASFSMFHFHRIFKAVTGETVAGFTRRLRLELAANRLFSKQFDDITVIAADCGFSSLQNFAKAFRRHFGMTPSDYRISRIGNIKSKNGNAKSLDTLYNPDTDFNTYSDRPLNKEMKAEVREMPEQKTAYYYVTAEKTPMAIGEGLSAVMQYAGNLGVSPSGTPFTAYHGISRENMNIEVGFPFREKIKGKGNIKSGEIPEGRYAVCIHTGPYELLGSARAALHHWVSKNRYKANEVSYEFYLNNPLKVQPEKLRTKIMFQVE